MSTRGWQLLRGDELLGEIDQTGIDFPWHYGTFKPTAAFANVSELFAKTQKLVEAEEFDTPESDAAFHAVEELGLSVREVGGMSFEDVLISIEGSLVTWRCG